MNRYNFELDRNGYWRKSESPTGEYYSRADLIAAGVLVPVPDGEACALTHYFKFTYLVYDGEVYEPHDHEYIWKSITSNNRLCDYHNTIVQPVRLVKLEDVG